MKRLFYVTNSLDDAELISDEVHAMGIDDHHFFVFSRDEEGINTHHLHGGENIDKSHIIESKNRATTLAVIAFFIALALLVVTSGLFGTQAYVILVASCAIFFAVKAGVSVAGGSWDEYFKGVFNEKLNTGNVIIVIDADRKQCRKIEKQLNKHPDASFLADSLNFSSPIPE